MSRRKKFIFGLFGTLIGICFGTLLRNYQTLEFVSMCSLKANMKYKTPLEIIDLSPEETVINSQRNLVFVGVMTAKDFLNDRAKAVYDTWGRTVPGRIAFFSSEKSVSDDLPVIALKGVDDRYPPQKKSFMMLYYMYEHFIDKFEWFARADDDVFIRGDKLEKFLRSIDSSKPQFIGQAGKGNSEEFGLLSLEFDENFCMGGPGVILSRETLRRVAPHIPTCLKNLYSTHEDVEIGRCVQKFAGIPCTWNYEMQSILHHNSSGNRAFTGNLKNREVHSAISLHPIKRAPLMYRLHAYMSGIKAHDLRQDSLSLHRDIMEMTTLLQIPSSNKLLAPDVPIYSDEFANDYSEDPDILGRKPNLNRYKPHIASDIIEWDFIAKSLYSSLHANPKRKIESSMREGLDDIIREVMENINNYSRQRGRVIEFRELLYGYSRIDILHGHDLILDLLLIYKKYRGKKMTVPVRRHLYIQRSFTEVRIREICNELQTFDYDKLSSSSSTYYDNGIRLASIHNHVKKIWITGIEKLQDKLTLIKTKYNSNINNDNNLLNENDKCLNNYNYLKTSKIIFILPLAGRYDTFRRFLTNYQNICLNQSNGLNTELIIALFVDAENPQPFINEINQINNQYNLNNIKIIKLNGNFSRGLALDTVSRSDIINFNDILFFIDVDIIFTESTLDRIRKNTIQGKQIYLPIVFSEYNPKKINQNELLNEGNDDNDLKKHLVINNVNGYFRLFGYGICSIYKSDILNPSIDGLNVDIKGWGLEDVKFLERIITSSNKPNLHILNQPEHNINNVKPEQRQTTATEIDTNINLKVFRAPDPSLIHIYHKIVCNQNLDESQLKMCFGTKANTFGDRKTIERNFINNRDILLITRKHLQQTTNNLSVQNSDKSANVK